MVWFPYSLMRCSCLYNIPLGFSSLSSVSIAFCCLGQGQLLLRPGPLSYRKSCMHLVVLHKTSHSQLIVTSEEGDDLVHSDIRSASIATFSHSKDPLSDISPSQVIPSYEMITNMVTTLCPSIYTFRSEINRSLAKPTPKADLTVFTMPAII